MDRGCSNFISAARCEDDNSAQLMFKRMLFTFAAERDFFFCTGSIPYPSRTSINNFILEDDNAESQ